MFYNGELVFYYTAQDFKGDNDLDGFNPDINAPGKGGDCSGESNSVEQSICKIDEYGIKRWYLNGLRHRENGPAVEYANGDKEWYLNGLLHREDGPATEYINGNKEWWLNGELIRKNFN